MMMKLIIGLLLVCCIAYGLGDGGTIIFNPLFASRMGRETHWVTPTPAPTYISLTEENSEDFNKDEVIGRLPGQPCDVPFKQYSGYITVDELNGRSLFYYFVEAEGGEATSKPLVLWMNGGPGMSSLVGALVENGPFGINPDGKTLHLRNSSWTRVANMLYIESPAGVGFSYSNTSADYDSTGDVRSAQDSYIFLLKWFQKFPHYKTCDFYITGESYAGYSGPELADMILSNLNAHSSLAIRLKGIMIGNGLMDLGSDLRGIYEFLWTHALISNQTHQELVESCLGPIIPPICRELDARIMYEMGHMDLSNLISEGCTSSPSTVRYTHDNNGDPSEMMYTVVYLNLPEVQECLRANTTRLSYPWVPYRLYAWRDSPSTLLPVYRKLIAAGLRILLYSGDMDALIPVTSTLHGISALNLTVDIPWRPWVDGSKMVGGSRIDFKGLTFATVRGAGHQVPRFQPRRALSLLKLFLEGS